MSGHPQTSKGISNKRRKIYRWIKIIVLVYFIIGFVLYFFQNKFFLHPSPLPYGYQYKFDHPFKEVNIEINKDEDLNLVEFFPTGTARKGVVLYFHGNMTNINHYAKFATNFTKNGYEVWMPDYPGFGKTTGKLTEKKLYEQALLVYKLANTQFMKDSIIIYGKSFGTGIAAELATGANCKRLILETPYSSIPDLFACYAPIYPTSLMAEFKIPTIDFLKEITAPVTIFHGDDDEVIPYRCAAKLKRVLKPGDEFITIAKGKHNDLNKFTLFHHKLDSLLHD